MKKIKVEIPAKYMKSSKNHIGYYSISGFRIVVEKRFVNPGFAKLLKDHKISFDTTRGLMFFNTEEQAALFKLSHL